MMTRIVLTSVAGLGLAMSAASTHAALIAVTYDFARLMTGATELKTSEFGDEIVRHM